MYVRFSIITGEKTKVDAAVDYIEATGRPQVEAAAGNQGFVTFTATDPGVVVCASYWADAAAMAASGAALAAAREDSATTAGGQLTGEEYEMVIGFRQSIPARGAVVRLARMQVDPGKVEQAITFYRDESVPRVKGAAGLCSFQLLLNRDTGAGMVATAWEDERSAGEFWPTAEELRGRAAQQVGIAFGGIENYSLVRTTVQLG